MPEHVVQLVADGLNDERKAMKGSRILCWACLQKDIDDVRESPALSIIDRLRARGAEVRYHDPFVNEVHFDDAHTEGGGEPLASVPLSDEELRASDCVLIVTDHSATDYQRVCQLSSLMWTHVTRSMEMSDATAARGLSDCKYVSSFGSEFRVQTD